VIWKVLLQGVATACVRLEPYRLVVQPFFRAAICWAGNRVSRLDGTTNGTAAALTQRPIDLHLSGEKAAKQRRHIISLRLGAAEFRIRDERPQPTFRFCSSRQWRPNSD
jgi:hypothetical protein